MAHRNAVSHIIKFKNLNILHCFYHCFSCPSNPFKFFYSVAIKIMFRKIKVFNCFFPYLLQIRLRLYNLLIRREPAIMLNIF